MDEDNDFGEIGIVIYDKTVKREIKFRGKSTLIGEWLYGSLLVWPDGDCYMAYALECDTSFELAKERIAPDTVGQFTGLYDKNGNDIYEGDIIEVLDSQNIPCRRIVKYIDQRGGYAQFLFEAESLHVEPFDCGLLCQQYITDTGKYIIGNIYDHRAIIK